MTDTTNLEPSLRPVDASIEEAFRTLSHSPLVKSALAGIEADLETTLADQIALTEIPSPTFKEGERAAEFMRRLQALGLEDVRLDDAGNVVAVRPGRACGPHLVIAAHLDTVFPEGTDVKVRREGNVCRAPGISDDARGLAVLLEIVRTLEALKIRTVGSLVVAATVGEEGNGDLRGSKHFVAHPPAPIDGFIAVDGANVSRLLKGSAGSRRIRAVFTGPGGHSWNAFGRASANHALGRAVGKIAALEVSQDPKTTFTVGTLSGGTSVNAISGHAEAEIDMRSIDPRSLDDLYDRVRALLDEALAEENARWDARGDDAVTLSVVDIGHRPAGVCPPESELLQAARCSLKTLGIPLLKYAFASTDQNSALAAGIPATTLGGGGTEGFNHNAKEWFDTTNAHLGPQAALLTVLALLGVDGESEPILKSLR